MQRRCRLHLSILTRTGSETELLNAELLGKSNITGQVSSYERHDMWGSGGGGLGGYVLALRCTAPLTGHGDAIFGNSTVSNRKSRASRLTAVAKRSWLGRAIWATGACGLIGLDWVRNAPHASHARPAARHSDSALSSRSQSRLHAQARLALPRLALPHFASHPPEPTPLRIRSTLLAISLLRARPHPALITHPLPNSPNRRSLPAVNQRHSPLGASRRKRCVYPYPKHQLHLRVA